MPTDIETLIGQEVPAFEPSNPAVPFEALGIDSFDLISLRISIETHIKQPISDQDWVKLKSPADLIRVVEQMRAPKAAGAAPLAAGKARREHELNMALKGLSEPWLFKETGDFHWHLITQGLGAPSSALVDGNGDRLYATFTRIAMTMSHPLAAFEENQKATIDGSIERFGAGIFCGTFHLFGAGRTIDAKVMSSFTKRASETSNEGLLKGQPIIPDSCTIPQLSAMPPFGAGYRERRNATLAEPLFECDYEIIPYHDINGVGLMYFAAYPSINDICELRYMNQGNQWAMKSSTIARDVYYFANSDVDATLVYRVHRRRDNDRFVEIESSISRKSTNTLMAYLITRKARLDV
jgi:probable biosynthetic protein (TIGR04098 family)